MPQIVVGEVRANLARRRLSARQAAARLGWSQPYMARRMTGDKAFDVADLAALSQLLEVPIEDFFRAPRSSAGDRVMNALYLGRALAA